MSNIALSVEELNKIKPMEIVTTDKVREKFIQIYDTMWAPTTGVSGEAIYERESRAFNRILGEKEDIRNKSTHFSIFTSFLDIAISGLSVEPGTRAQAYLMSRNVQTGTNEQGQKVYSNLCVLTVSGYGEMVLRARCGQIRHADNPVIVYKEDSFEFGEQNGQKFVNYICRLPHTSNEIVAAFMKITRNDGTTDYAVLLPADWQRLAGYSAKQNSKWDKNVGRMVPGNANALYASNNGQIDTGFLAAKLIKHAFKSYPKARVGRGTQLESQQVEEMEINDDIYGVSGGDVVDMSTGEVIETPNNFGPAADTSAGVVVDPAQNDSAAPAADNDDVF